MVQYIKILDILVWFGILSLKNRLDFLSLFFFEDNILLYHRFISFFDIYIYINIYIYTTKGKKSLFACTRARVFFVLRKPKKGKCYPGVYGTFYRTCTQTRYRIAPPNKWGWKKKSLLYQLVQNKTLPADISVGIPAQNIYSCCRAGSTKLVSCQLWSCAASGILKVLSLTRVNTLSESPSWCVFADNTLG